VRGLRYRNVKPKRKRLRNTTHPLGMPCNGPCEGIIPFGSSYMEEVRADNDRRAYCGACRPEANDKSYKL
jgi:hypothetical protein